MIWPMMYGVRFTRKSMDEALTDPAIPFISEEIANIPFFIKRIRAVGGLTIVIFPLFPSVLVSPLLLLDNAP